MTILSSGRSKICKTTSECCLQQPTIQHLICNFITIEWFDPHISIHDNRCNIVQKWIKKVKYSMHYHHLPILVNFWLRGIAGDFLNFICMYLLSISLRSSPSKLLKGEKFILNRLLHYEFLKLKVMTSAFSC